MGGAARHLFSWKGQPADPSPSVGPKAQLRENHRTITGLLKTNQDIQMQLHKAQDIAKVQPGTRLLWRAIHGKSHASSCPASSGDPLDCDFFAVGSQAGDAARIQAEDELAAAKNRHQQTVRELEAARNNLYYANRHGDALQAEEKREMPFTVAGGVG